MGTLVGLNAKYSEHVTVQVRAGRAPRLHARIRCSGTLVATRAITSLFEDGAFPTSIAFRALETVNPGVVESCCSIPTCFPAS